MSKTKKSEEKAKPKTVAKTTTNRIHEDGMKATVVLGGEATEIRKLRAGQFYKAQKAFAELFSSVMDMVPDSSKKGSDSAIMKKVADGKFDSNNPKQMEELAKEMQDKQSQQDTAKMMEVMMIETPQKMATFVALCCEMELEEFEDTAYPEEVGDAFKTCMELNDVVGNLKKLGAPMQALRL